MVGLLQEGTDGNVLAATAKQVSKSTIQLVLACQVLFCLVRRTFGVKDFHGIRADKDDTCPVHLQVKADAASEIMVGLKEASNDVRRAADQLVKATKKTLL